MSIVSLKRVAATATLFFAVAAASEAEAQSGDYEDLSVEEALQVCAAFSDKDDRLACFEALAASAGGAKPSAAVAPEGISPAPVASPPPVAPPPAVAETDKPVPPPAVAEGPAPAASAPEAPKAAPRFTFLKNDPMEVAKRKGKRYETTVYRAWRNPLGELRVAMTNGDIWVQAGRGVRYTPSPGERVVMKPGLVGGWTISMDGGKAGVRARLLKPKE